ncbi:hypothetical protein [Snuella sedimenti]|uniref:Uncharacterized protein n=1 Tax=Snuella sedimenti TaxID=2798802 RepID=A0A8J7LNK9_9FLAO|nr:hypothetical protein [Snuella sedimenti]MBJ6368068.1 hypothetical protein [Snuella sedimenti]
MRVKNNRCFIKAFCYGFCVLLILFSCQSKADNEAIFKSHFKSNDGNVTSIGAQYWSNSLQDWYISDNRLECLVSDDYRNIYLLSRRLNKQEGYLEMKVRLGFFNKDVSYLNNNWAGFSIGSKRKLNDDNDNTTLSDGINLGVCTNGTLFIGEPSPNHKNQDVLQVLDKGVDLKVNISFVEGSYIIDLSLSNIETGKILANISKKNVSQKLLSEGSLVLVSNFENTERNKVNRTKSVWFKDWEIKGTKLTRVEK